MYIRPLSWQVVKRGRGARPQRWLVISSILSHSSRHSWQRWFYLKAFHFLFFFLQLNLPLIKLWERQTMSIIRVVRCLPLQGSSLSKQGTWHCVVLVNVTRVQKWAWSEGEDKGKVVSAAGTGQASCIMDPPHWAHLKCTLVWRLVFDRQSMNWVNNCSQWP